MSGFSFRRDPVLKAVVTGLPRSGTSFVAGMAARLGLCPGPRLFLRRGNRYNPHGYFEHIPLNRITNRLLSDMGRDFDLNLPGDREEFETPDLGRYRAAIRRWVRCCGVEIYKDNKLILYPELYAQVFPKAKWVFVSRDPEARFASRFGKVVSRKRWEEFNAGRLALWRASPVSESALNISYESFFHDLDGSIEAVAGHLGLVPDDAQRAAARDFFRPRPA